MAASGCGVVFGQKKDSLLEHFGKAAQLFSQLPQVDRLSYWMPNLCKLFLPFTHLANL